MRALPVLPWVCAVFLGATLFSHTVALRLILLLCGAALAAIALWQERDWLRRLPPAFLLFVLWAAWCLASLLWSIEPDRSQKEWRNEILYTGLAFWMCFVAAQAPNAARIFLGIVGAGIAASIAVALWSFSRGWAFYLEGPHGGPGDHSSALITLLPCVAMLGWYGKRNGWPAVRLALLAALAVLFFASAYATLNRTLWIAFGLQFALLSAFLMLRMGARPIGRRGKALAVGAVVVALAGTAAVMANIQGVRRDVGAGGTIQGDHRLALWSEVVELVQERPLTGFGFGRGLIRDALREELGNRDNLWHAHNLFLEALVQTGVPGLVLLLALFAFILAQALRHARSSADAVAACGMALMAVIAGMAMRNMTDTLLVRQNALLFWGVVGVLLGWISSGGARGTAPPSRS